MADDQVREKLKFQLKKAWNDLSLLNLGQFACNIELHLSLIPLLMFEFVCVINF